MPRNSSLKNLLILGGAGFAREVACLVSDINQVKEPIWNIIGFWEGEEGETSRTATINGIALLNTTEIKKFLPDLSAIVAISKPAIRQRAVRQAEKLGCVFATLIHPSVRYDHKTITIGQGSIICAGSLISVNVSIGSHVVVNWHCTIGHDSILHDFVTISPGCHISGHTSINPGSYIGAGAVTIERHTIGENSIIGAGAVVATDIPDNVTAVGIPARIKVK
jgi:sugar O-acyltransferase (sialic acid O-acetyltransferase NeuD family)